MNVSMACSSGAPYLGVFDKRQQQASLHLGQLHDEIRQKRPQHGELLLNPPHILQILPPSHPRRACLLDAAAV